MTNQEPKKQGIPKEIFDRLDILEEHQANLENRVQDIEEEMELRDGDPI